MLEKVQSWIFTLFFGPPSIGVVPPLFQLIIISSRKNDPTFSHHNSLSDILINTRWPLIKQYAADWQFIITASFLAIQILNDKIPTNYYDTTAT